MQFIEKNSLNVRSAIYHLKNNDSKLEFILFPMIHVGARRYFDDVSDRLANCDLILAEGVNSKKARLLTLSYRIVRKIRRMDLITQSEGIKLSKFRKKILNTDMAGSIFDEHWTALPLVLRVQIVIAVPVFVAYLFFFGTRSMLAENIAVQDLPSRDEILEDDKFEKLDDLLLEKRDRKLVENIEKLHRAEQPEKLTVAVVYGARHMRHVITFLSSKFGYKITTAEWVTVFDL